MEYRFQHSRNYSESDKQILEHLSSDHTATRKKLLEKGFKKDRISPKPHQLSNPFKPPRFSLPSSSATPAPLLPKSQDPSLPKSSATQHPSHKRTSSMEKIPTSSTITSDQEKLSHPPRKPKEKPTDCILKVAKKLSVKKINVSLTQELFRINSSGDSFVCRSLLALLTEVDYHIRETQNFTIESFFEYISMPGIVIQTIKRLPELLCKDRINKGMVYVDCFAKALELFNQAGEISKIPGVEIVAELMQVVFSFKGLVFKPLDLGNYGEVEKVVRHKTVQSADYGKSKQVEVPLIKVVNLEEPIKVTPQKPPRFSTLSSSPKSEFMQSKSELLTKFYTKMGISQADFLKREKSPLKDFLNHSQDFTPAMSDQNFYIKPKSSARPSSVTPRSTSSSHSKVFKEHKSNKSIPKERIEDIKKTQFLLGSRFYKKIDQKFVEKLLEKMKKETLDVKKMRSVNFEEYVKRKNQFINENKKRWVVETLRYLETSDLLVPANENDLGQDARHDALLAHLSQEQHVSTLVRKAEQMEIASRRGCAY